MKLLSEMPGWAGMSILLLLDLFVISVMRAYDQRQNRRYLHAERERMAKWAEERAEQLAGAKYTEYMIQERLRKAGDRNGLDPH